MIKFVIVNWVITLVIAFIKSLSLKKYVEENNIVRVKDKDFADSILGAISCGIPIFNWVVIGVMLFVDNEHFADELIKKGVWAKKDGIQEHYLK